VDALRVADWPLGGPEGVVWVARTGRLYVADAVRGRIVVFNLRR
jgi:sugar lactone lactonase YvrE